MRTKCTQNRECEFSTSVTPATYNFNPVKCTHFPWTVPSPGPACSKKICTGSEAYDIERFQGRTQALPSPEGEGQGEGKPSGTKCARNLISPGKNETKRDKIRFAKNCTAAPQPLTTIAVRLVSFSIPDRLCAAHFLTFALSHLLAPPSTLNPQLSTLNFLRLPKARPLLIFGHEFPQHE